MPTWQSVSRVGQEGGPVPAGVALRDAREQMFAAAERILLREGPHALTSRAVTAEAGVAKGVLHRHFHDSAGTGTVAGNLTSVLTDLFSSVAVAIVALITFRDDLRARLRATTPRGVPLLTEAGAMIA